MVVNVVSILIIWKSINIEMIEKFANTIVIIMADIDQFEPSSR
jgi:hypothetical protein